MNKRSLAINALLLGTSGALLWIMGKVVLHGNILLGEPNKIILALELLLISSIMVLAITSLAIDVKNTLRRE